MTCRELTDFLDRYLDDELPIDVERTCEAHVRICPDCRAYLETYARTIEVVRKSGARQRKVELPESLVAVILQSVRSNAPRKLGG